MTLTENVAMVRSRMAAACRRAGRPEGEVTLVAVTKTVDAETIRAAFKAGVRHFGANRIQEARAKLEELSDVRGRSTWHMVGHLQTNKAKLAAGLFDIIQSVDSVRLSEVISRHAESPMPVMIEVNIGSEVTKSGVAPEELEAVFETVRNMPNVDVIGLMTVPPWMGDPERVRPFFRRLRRLRDSLGLRELSMGMTDDFEVAIEEGATMVRVGRAIFGERRA